MSQANGYEVYTDVEFEDDGEWDSQDPLVGMYAHAVSNLQVAICYVVAVIDEERYLVKFFPKGNTSYQKVIPIDKMGAWMFYDNIQDLKESMVEGSMRAQVDHLAKWIDIE